MTLAPRRSNDLGFTMIEAVFAVALFAIIAIKVALVMDSAGRSYREESRQAALEDQARAVLERIALAVMGSDRDGLNPDQASPLSSNQLTYQVNLGVQDGQVVWSDPERITTDGANGEQIVWLENPGAAQERRIVWANIARPFLEGELLNGADDNGNGLVDETGLSFDVDGSKVSIRLTLSRPGEEGVELVRTVETEATCRN